MPPARSVRRGPRCCGVLFCRWRCPAFSPARFSVFVLAVSAYVTPVLVGGMRVKTMAVVIVDTLLDQFQWPFGSALALMLALASALVIVAFVSLTRVRWR